MKRLSYLFRILTLIVFLCTFRAQATDMNAQIVQVNDLTYDIQISAASSGTNLGSSTFIFTYNTSTLSYPGSPVSGTDYDFTVGSYNSSSNGYVGNTVTDNGSGTISVNIAHNFGTTGAAVGTSYSTVVRIKFTYGSTPSGTPDFTWAMSTSGSGPVTLTDVYEDDEATNYTEGTFANPGFSALPVSLLSFDANLKNNKVYLDWVTASEQNNAKFDVERSKNGVDFSQIDEIAGAGNSNVVRNYNAMDEMPLPGVSYYRLKQTDFNGTYTYSSIVAVNNTGVDALAFNSITPSLFSDHVMLDYTLTADGMLNLLITNSQGATVLQQSINGHKGNNTYSVNGLFGLKPGIYYAHLRSDNFDQYQKMVKVN
jgi:hypothetical protein